MIILFETYFEIPVWSFLCGCFDILFLLDRGWVCYFSCWIIGDWFWSVSLWPLSYFATSGCKFGLKFSLFHIFLLLPTSTSHFIRFNYYSVCSHWYSISAIELWIYKIFNWELDYSRNDSRKQIFTSSLSIQKLNTIL